MSDDLYHLLGLPADTPPPRLRQVYEEQVTSAVRSSDHRRALALSTALDNLDPSTRERLYPRMTSRGTAAVASRPSVRPSISRPTGVRRTRSWRRNLVYMAVVVAIGGLVYLDVAQSKPSTSGARGPSPTREVSSPSGDPQVTVRDARVAVRAVEQCRTTTGSLPPSAPTQAGRATLRCGDGSIALDLRSGGSLTYTRLTARRYTVQVPGSNGDTVRYDSRTGMFSR